MALSLRFGHAVGMAVIFVFAAASSCSDGALVGGGSKTSGKEKKSDESKDDEDEDLKAVPPEVVSGAYLTCQAVDGETLGCVVSTSGGAKADLAGTKLKWEFKSQDGKRLTPKQRKLKTGSQLHGLFVFAEGELQTLASTTVGIKGSDKTVIVKERPKSGSEDWTIIGVDLGQEKEGAGEEQVVEVLEVEASTPAPAPAPAPTSGDGDGDGDGDGEGDGGAGPGAGDHLAFATKELYKPGVPYNPATADKQRFKSLLDADQICDDVGPDLAGKRWKAILSSPTASAKERLGLTGAVFEYKQAPSMIASAGKFWSTDHFRRIDEDQAGVVIDAAEKRAWTGTKLDGSSSGLTCADWNNETNENADAAKATNGNISQHNTTGWIEEGPVACNSSLRLLCISVPN